MFDFDFDSYGLDFGNKVENWYVGPFGELH